MDEDEDRLKQIQDKWRLVYNKTIPDKIKGLESLIQKLDKDFQLSTLKDFRREVHKIAGSAGTVGYMSVSVICKRFDKDLFDKIENIEIHPAKPEWIQEFYSYLDLIRDGFSSVDT